MLKRSRNNQCVQREVREEAKQKFIGFLEKKDLRITNQRRVIIDTVFDTNEHFTAEQLLEWARLKDSSRYTHPTAACKPSRQHLLIQWRSCRQQ